MEMSENVYENSEDSADSYEDIYMNEDILETRPTRSHKGTMTSGQGTAWSRCYRVTAVCLLVLCLLLLTAITLLWIKFNNQNNQLQTRYNNLTIEGDQLQTRYNNLTIRRDQLQTSYNTVTKKRDQLQTRYNTLSKERDQLQTRYNTLTIERDQLQTRYNTLTKERDQLQTRYNTLTIERDQLQMYRDYLFKLDSGWTYFSSSLYYISTVKKIWPKSRDDCRQRGADLVIINSKDEQEFLSKSFGNTEAWIGLTDRKTGGVFKWVDDTPLTTEFWWNGEPNDYGYRQDCAITGYKKAESNMSNWADYPCDIRVVGICEINIFN